MRGLALGLLVALVAGRAGAQGAPAHGPCLVARPNAAAYAAAFMADGWTPALGAARVAALRGPGEAIHFLTFLPGAATTEGELDAELVRAHERAESNFLGASVLTRGDLVVAIQVEAVAGGQQVRCILTGPDLPGVDGMLARNPARTWGDMTMAVETPAPPKRARDLRLEAMRLAPAVTPSEPLLADESLSVSLVVEAAR